MRGSLLLYRSKLGKSRDGRKGTRVQYEHSYIPSWHTVRLPVRSPRCMTSVELSQICIQLPLELLANTSLCLFLRSVRQFLNPASACESTWLQNLRYCYLCWIYEITHSGARFSYVPTPKHCILNRGDATSKRTKIASWGRAEEWTLDFTMNGLESSKAQTYLVTSYSLVFYFSCWGHFI